MSGAPLFVDVAGTAPGDLRAVDSGEAQILVCNADGEFYAIENKCPHIQIPLDGGRLAGCVLECPPTCATAATWHFRSASPPEPIV